MKKIGSFLVMLWGVLALIAGLFPLYYGVWHTGTVVLVVYGVLLLLLPLLWHAFDDRSRVYRRLREVSDPTRRQSPQGWKMIRSLWAAGLAAFTIFGAVLSVPMAYYAWMNPPTTAQTVIVLGCQATDGKPSLMLWRRIRAAAAYLQQNPEARVIGTGGLDSPTETLTEAQVIELELLTLGIEQERIYRDDQSTNTKENLANAAEIIQKNGLSTDAAIATDDFHQLRGQLYARKNGLRATALPSLSPWGLFPSYWVREWFGIVKGIFLD